jgi:hypothetical protein
VHTTDEMPPGFDAGGRYHTSAWPGAFRLTAACIHPAGRLYVAVPDPLMRLATIRFPAVDPAGRLGVMDVAVADVSAADFCTSVHVTGPPPLPLP